jgi:cytochrome P450
VPGKSGVRLRQEKEAKLWTGQYKQGGAQETYVSGALETKANEDGPPLFENETEAKFAVGMLCIVGVFTIAGPAVLFAMAMILHPERQQKVRAQINEVCGEDELLNLKHSPRLPILHAAIKECMGWKSTVSLGEYCIFSRC